MKKFNKIIIVVALIGLLGPVATFAATAPSLGGLSTYGVVSDTYTNTVGGTTIKGDVCYTTPPATMPTISGATVTPCAPSRGTDQSGALATLNGQACTTIAGDLNAVTIGANPPGTFPPGCYTMAGAMNITLSTNVTLDGAALGGDGGSVWIFRSGAALTTGANSRVLLTHGATANKVFWAPVGATTLLANTAFVGNILDAAGITFGNSATLMGRALAFGETVKTTLTNTISVPATLHVVKVVVNGGGGTKVPLDFNLYVKLGGSDVTGSPALGVVAPGTAYSLAAGTYVVSEDATFAATYTQSFSATCPGGSITLAAGEDKTCTITNTEIIASPATLHVIKTVVNAGPGTSVSSDFNLYVKKAGVDVVSPAPGVASPGTAYSLAAGTYVVSEDANSLYTKVFNDDCNLSGSVTLAAGEDKTCTIVNTDILALSSGGGYYNAPLPLISVTKIPSPLNLPGGAGSVTYTYTATNVGVVAMRGVWVKDDKCTPVTFVSGDTNSDSMLDVGESWIYTCTKTVSATETNIATAHGNANGWDGYDTALATVVVGKSVIPPLIHLVKKPNVFVLPSGGGAVTYTYTVTNPGTEPLSNVSITDDKCTGLPGRVVGHPGDLNKNDLLESNESWSFTCKTNLTQTTTNIGTAIGYANGLSAVDVSPATVAVSAPGLPNTGFPSDTRDVVILALSCALLLVSVSLAMILKKVKI